MLKVVEVVEVLLVAPAECVQDELHAADRGQQQRRRRAEATQQVGGAVEAGKEPTEKPVERLLGFESEGPSKG